MRALPLVLFDALFVVFAAIVYGASLGASFAAADLVWGMALWRKAAAVLVGYAVFLHAFIVVIAVVRRLVQPKLAVGFCKVGLNKKYMAWGLNSIFQALFTTSVFDRQVHLVFYLKYLYYRAMGMRLSFNSIIGTRAVIRQAELIELGSKVVLGEMSSLYGHVSPDGKRHFQGRITIGDGSVVGASAVVGPDVTIGKGSVLGPCSLVMPMVRIGNDVQVGGGSILHSRVNIPDGVEVMAGSVVAHGTKMEPGETWGGNPAVKLDRKPRKAGRERAAESLEEVEA